MRRDGWAFLHAHGFEPTGEMADLIALKSTMACAGAH